MRKGTVLAIVVAIAALFGAWYWGSPRYSLHAMRAAAEAGDTDTLASYVDFPALRASMKEELKAKAAAELTKSGQNGMAAFGAAIAMNMIDGVVDGMITPTTMRKAFVADKTKGPPGVQNVDASRSDMVIDRKGFSRFLLHEPKDAEHGLIFTRDGMGWKLSGLRLPE